MGNSASQPNPAEAMDSRVIKISESVAHRLLVPAGGRNISIEAPTSESRSSGSAGSGTSNSPLSPLRKPFRRDPSVIGEDVFLEFEKQEVVNDLQMTSLGKKISDASKAFNQKPVAIVDGKFEVSDEQGKVLSCLKANNGAGLNCHSDVVNFVSFVENNSSPASAQ